MKKEQSRETKDFNDLKLTFSEFYWAQKGMPFSWNGKELGNLKLMQKRLISLIKTTKASLDDKQDNEVEVEDNELVDTFKLMLKAIVTCKKLRWVYDEVTPSIINNKLNVIVAEAKKLKKENYGELIEDLTTNRNNEVSYQEFMQKLYN